MHWETVVGYALGGLALFALAYACHIMVSDPDFKDQDFLILMAVLQSAQQ